MDLVGLDTDTAENFENLSAIKPEEIIITPSNMGIRRHEQRHSPSLENLFSNRDGKTLFLMLESFFVAGLFLPYNKNGINHPLPLLLGMF